MLRRVCGDSTLATCDLEVVLRLTFANVKFRGCAPSSLDKA